MDAYIADPAIKEHVFLSTAPSGKWNFPYSQIKSLQEVLECANRKGLQLLSVMSAIVCIPYTFHSGSNQASSRSSVLTAEKTHPRRVLSRDVIAKENLCMTHLSGFIQNLKQTLTNSGRPRTAEGAR